MSPQPSEQDASQEPINKAVSLDHDLEKSSKDDDSPNETDITKYPTGFSLFLIFLSLCLGTFLVALDATIIATAIPTITSHFNSLGDYAWYNAAFLLTTCAFQLPFGRAYSLLNTKWTFMFAIFIFEVGSAICGAAPTSIALIIGRAISGIGGAGIFGGAFIIIAQNTPLRKRSLLTGFIGAMFAIASVIGPILGGAFTTKVSWRWCFYINLPIGGLVLVIVFFSLPKPAELISPKLKGKTWWQVLKCFNPIGTLLLIPSITCLVLALQWGGLQYSWSSQRVIVTLTLFGISFVAWAILQAFQGDEAMVPRSVVCQRSVAATTIYTLFGSAAFSTIVYYLPIWFQAIRQNNAEQSGIHILPLILSVVVFALGSGGAVVAIGYYTPFLILGSICCSVGAGLLMLLQPDASNGEWIGYQILFGAGVGMSLEQCNVAAQTVLPEDKVPLGISMSVLARSLGGALAVSIAENVFEQKLRKSLSEQLPNLNPSIVSDSGATNLISNVLSATGGSQTVLQTVIDLYNNAIVQAFLVALILAAVTVPAGLAVEWKSVKKEKKEVNRSDGK